MITTSGKHWHWYGTVTANRYKYPLTPTIWRSYFRHIENAPVIYGSKEKKTGHIYYRFGKRA